MLNPPKCNSYIIYKSYKSYKSYNASFEWC